PWGRGYPGWHIECSAMSMKYLGEQFDIHTGGIDHIPIHHTNELAQSEGAIGKKWVNYWLHNEFLVIAKEKTDEATVEVAEKMSKSHGNFLTLQSLVDKGYNALDYRFFLLGAHYRKQVFFSWSAMDSAKNSRQALIQRISRLAKSSDDLVEKTYSRGEAVDMLGLSEKAAAHIAKFKEALENDLSSPVALSELQKTVKDPDLAPFETIELVNRMDSVMGLKLVSSAKKLFDEQKDASNTDLHKGDPEADEINALVAERADAKKSKNFVRADEIRTVLATRGIVIIDTPNGVEWKRV
ncbi:MAG: cysteine--tRNA ligase, partial [Treponemataceae bacterium]|nr:cysteine--tRNA ligase [Treponemataceae bacterium]